MATANFTINPEDGWVAVTTADCAFIRIRSSVPNHAFYVTTDTATPASTVVGFKIDCNDFWVNVASGTQRYYVRTYQTLPQGNTISVFTL